MNDAARPQTCFFQQRQLIPVHSLTDWILFTCQLFLNLLSIFFNLWFNGKQQIGLHLQTNAHVQLEKYAGKWDRFENESLQNNVSIQSCFENATKLTVHKLQRSLSCYLMLGIFPFYNVKHLIFSVYNLNI